MPITKRSDGNCELYGVDAYRLAVSTGNDSELKDKIKRFLGRSVFIPEERAEAYLEVKGINNFATKTVLSGDPEAKPVSYHSVSVIKPKPDKADPITPTPPVSMDRADPMARDHRSHVGGKG